MAHGGHLFRAPERASRGVFRQRIARVAQEVTGCQLLREAVVAP